MGDSFDRTININWSTIEEKLDKLIAEAEASKKESEKNNQEEKPTENNKE